MELVDADRLAIIDTLARFNSEYQKLISKYNDGATAAWAHQERTDITPMLRERDDLVQATHDSLRAVLTADGWARFDAHIQGEKKHMKMSAPEVNQ